MEDTSRKRKVHPVLAELAAHKWSTLAVVLACLFSAYLNVASRGLAEGDPTDLPVLYIFAIAFTGIFGCYVTSETFFDTINASARDVQYALPMSARKRYLVKLGAIFVRHIVPAILSQGIFLVIGALVNASKGQAVVDIKYAAIQASSILLSAVMFDVITVLAMVCTGMGLTAILCGSLFFVSWGILHIRTANSQALLKWVTGERYVETDWYVNTVQVLVAVILLVIAGVVYTRRDGKHTGQLAAGNAALEVVLGASFLTIEYYLFCRDDTPILLVLFFVAYVGIHAVMYREKRVKHMLIGAAVFFAITLVNFGLLLHDYAEFREGQLPIHYNELVGSTAEFTDEEWENEAWREARAYTSGPDCELMVGDYRTLDTKWSEEYHIYNPDGSNLTREQFRVLHAALDEFCANNEPPQIEEVSFWDFAFTLKKGYEREWSQYGFMVTVSYGGGRYAERECYTGSLNGLSDNKLDLFDVIKNAGFEVRMVTNNRR